MAVTRSTCAYCGVGCGVLIESEGKQITGVRGDPDHPANRGRLCSKGATLHLTAQPLVQQQTRLLQPMVRAQRGQAPQAVAWDAALDTVATRLADIAVAHGPDAVGLYVSGQLLTEDYYAFNKFARGVLGTNNIDSNSRLCMSSAVAGYKSTLGSDAVPACYDDLAQAGTLFIAGANPAWAHPILFRRIEDAKRANPALKIIVCDPRRTDTAEAADLHLALRPGTDVMLFNGLLHCMLHEGWVDAAFVECHTTGLEPLRASIAAATPARVQEVCGVAPADVRQAAQWFAGVRADGARSPTLSLYCQGLNQSSNGTANNAALIALHLATGQIGKPGAGPLSLTGQPNVMGGREVGAMANLLSAHRELGNAEHRAEVAALWGLPSVPASPGKTALEMFEAAADGEIRALWIACTNPAHSLPHQSLVRRALERAEFVVLQDAYRGTATARYAEVLLPASTWGEKEGTVTNSERCISRVRAAVSAPGEARADWHIVVDVAQRVQARLPWHAGRAPLLPYTAPEAIWNEHRESTRGRDLDITGLSYARLERSPTQWPCPQNNTAPVPRLYTDGRFATADGRARLQAPIHQGVAEPCDARYPLALNTGRLRDQWHGMSRSGTVARLFGHSPAPQLQLHPTDAQRLALQDGDLAYLTSRRGTIVLPVAASDSLAPGQAYTAMHWGDEFLSGASSTGRRLGGVNAVSSDARCAQSRQPELKHAAVKVLKAELPWSLWAMAWLPDAQVHAARAALQEGVAGLAFASCTLLGGSENDGGSGVLLQASHHQAPDAALLGALEPWLGLAGVAVQRYSDPRRGQWRRALLVDAGDSVRLHAVLLAGDTRARHWIAPLLQERLPAHSYTRALMVPGATPPVAVPRRGASVCACSDVGEGAIVHFLKACVGTAQERLGALQASLRCGTNCGSCVPQLQRMVRASMG